MSFVRKFIMMFRGSENVFVPILAKQTGFLCQTSAMLLGMFEDTETSSWSRVEHEIKSCEVQGDALLTEFFEMLSETWLIQINKLDLQAVAMAMDDCLDVIKDTSKAILIYAPAKLDSRLKEIAQMAADQSCAIREMIPLLADVKKNVYAINHCCDRVTELEHAADDAYEEYIGSIFHEMEDFRELVKCKGLAEMLENETDAFKRISDNVRKLLLNLISA